LKARLLFEQRGGILPFVIKNWWVITILCLAYAVYFQALYHKKCFLSRLQETLEQMQTEKRQALEEREQLQLRIASQEDPEWIELVLKEKLGLIPEGQVKVVFQE
jgi:hypothetical protein